MGMENPKLESEVEIEKSATVLEFPKDKWVESAEAPKEASEEKALRVEQLKHEIEEIAEIPEEPGLSGKYYHEKTHYKTCEVCHGSGRKMFVFSCKACNGVGSVPDYVVSREGVVGDGGPIAG